MKKQEIRPKHKFIKIFLIVILAMIILIIITLGIGYFIIKEKANKLAEQYLQYSSLKGEVKDIPEERLQEICSKVPKWLVSCEIVPTLIEDPRAKELCDRCKNLKR